jgi:hypothetical protein
MLRRLAVAWCARRTLRGNQPKLNQPSRDPQAEAILIYSSALSDNPALAVEGKMIPRCGAPRMAETSPLLVDEVAAA